MSAQTNSTSEIHGHDVLAMMMASGRAYTRDSLLAAIAEKFGARARFCTCCTHDMTAAELVEFLSQRQKFAERPAGFVADPSRVCDHAPNG